MNRLREIREARGISQVELAEILREADPRMDRSMVSRFETGACLPTPEVLEAMERAVHASRSDLFGDAWLGDVPDEEPPERSRETEALLVLIPTGRENAISRRALAAAMQVTDRAMRRAVEQARREGVFICNDGDGRGYYRSTVAEDLRRLYWRETKRGKSILRTRKALRRALKEMGENV